MVANAGGFHITSTLAISDETLADYLETTEQAGFVWEACQAFQPRRTPTLLSFCRREIVTDKGRPYDHGAYPHLGAPGGPMDAFDNPSIRRIVMEWATRLGKTFLWQCAQIFTALHDPADMMDANATEKLVLETIDRSYKMLRHRSTLRAMLLKRWEKDQRQNQIELIGCTVFGAWARSASTLADKNIKVGHAGEIDKWEHASTSGEADPFKLWQDRFKDFAAVCKQIIESTPGIRHRSRIEPMRQGGTDCKLYVPCPHCFRFQKLEFGSPGVEHGLKFDRAASGYTDPQAARESARYVCLHCHGVIADHHRAWVIRRGVWVPAGATVRDDVAREVAESRIADQGELNYEIWRGWKSSPWIEGLAQRDGITASYQLSSLYALSLSWGDVAEEFAGCKDRPQFLRNFVNSWLAETWEPRKSKSTPERVAERLNNKLETGIVPDWGRFVTITADRQAADGGYVVYVVLAHGPDDMAAEIAHGQVQTLEELWSDVIDRTWRHADGGEPLTAVISGVDSGWDTKKTYEFCNAHSNCYPIKGSDGDLGGEPYRVSEVGRGSRSGMDGQTLLMVNTDFWETDLQHRLDELKPGDAGSLALSADGASDWDLIHQLLNAVLTDKKNTRGNERLLWVKKRESDPNDYRDAVRYGLCLARAWLDDGGGVVPVRRKPVENQIDEQAGDEKRFIRKITIRSHN